MNELKLGRRTFFQTTGLALFAAAASSYAAPSQKRWMVACRDAHLKVMGKPDCWSAMKELGVRGVEVTVSEDLSCPALFHPEKKYSLATSDSIKVLADDLAANNAVITAFCTHNRFDEKLDKELALLRVLVPASQKFGVTVIRIDLAPHKMKPEEFGPFGISTCKQLVEITEGTPVRYGIENHSRVTNDPAFLDRMFDAVPAKSLGLTLDALNFYWFGHPLDELYKIYEKYAPKVFHTHCKSVRYPAEKRNERRPIGWEYAKYASPIYNGDIDYKRVVRILRAANYQGDLCLENECVSHFPAEERPGVLKKEIAMLKGLV